jgi:hypothetical protein
VDVGDDPPEAWQTAQRLAGESYDRHEVLPMLASSIAAELGLAQTSQQPFDRPNYLQRLELLPESWERVGRRRR